MAIFMFALFTSISMIIGVLIVCFTSPKPSKTCELAFERISKSSISFSSQPRSVAVGDFNNDNRMDIVVANSGTNTIGIFLSYEDGTFANQMTYSTGPQSCPYSVAVSDFNNDTYLDITVANYGDNNIGIFLGNKNGTFANQKIISTGSSRPLFITSGDFNDDHRWDIAVVNYGTDSVGILLGYGNGSFQIPITHSTGYDSHPHSLAVGNFNEDNHLDIAVANYGTNNIGILLGNGNGSFENQKTYTTAPNSNPSSIVVGHFNNDNYLDIVVANYGTGNISIFLGFQNGTLSAQKQFSVGSRSRPQYIIVGDFDNDNELDIVIVDSENDQIHILSGFGNGTFAAVTTYDAVSDSRPFSVAVADFDKDNRSDIVVANYGTNNVIVLSGYSMKPSARQTNYYLGPGKHPSSVAIGNLNNDNHLDIVVNGYIRDGILLLTGYGNGTFVSEATYSTGNLSLPQYICISDLNNDNRMDMVTANYGTNSISVFLQQDNETFANMTTYFTGVDSKPRLFALGDVNSDNQMDIVSANADTNSVGVFLGNGNGTFVAVETYSTGIGSTPYSVAVGDFNNDHQLDIVTANYDSQSIGVLLGYGNGTFGMITTYPIGFPSGPLSIALADFNRDNHLDIVVANIDAGNVGVILRYNDSGFGIQTTYSTGYFSQPYFVIVADFNNDHRYDIAATLFGNDEVVIFFGYGDGTFELARTYSTGFGSHPYGIAVADLNNDEQLEIVVALWGTGNVAVLTGYYAAKFANQATYSTGSNSQSYSVAIGDFNNDHRSDIVVANSGTDNLGILLGLGNGTFGTQTMYFIGTDSHPQYVITGDINKDNQLDIVSVNSKNDSISLILGYGNGSFAPQTMYSTGNSSHPSVAIFGDLNNDNRWDLVIANSGTDSIGILFGYNYSSFQSRKIYSSTSNVPQYAIKVIDINNDSYPDIAFTLANSNNIAVFLGDGNGSFGDMVTYPTGNGSIPSSLAIGDFNNDDRLDIVVGNQKTNNIALFLGYGNGSFAPMMTFSTGDLSNPVAIAAGEFDNDGRLDTVVANSGTDNVGILLGYGNGSFAAMVTFSTGNGSTPLAVAVSDFNNDNQSDIVIVNNEADNVGILLGFGNGSFANQVTYSTDSASQPYSVAVGDFNKDNRLDICVANFNLNNVGILLGYGNGTFAAIKTYSTGDGATPVSVSVGDFNNDNRLDIAVSNYAINNIVILFGFGDGSFLLGTAYSTGTESAPSALAVGDFNNDNRLDVAVTNSRSNDTVVFLGYGSQLFAGVTTYATGDGSQPYSVAIGDFNNDGRSDIVVANYGTDNVGIFIGRSNRVFDSMVKYPTGVGSAPYSVAVGDFNSDNQSDIVVTNSEIDQVAILLGYGNGSFAIGAVYSTGTRSRPYTVTISDFNNDSISDLAIANSGTNNIFLLYGYGNGTFGNKASYVLGYGYHPYSIAATDLNEDGWMDIVIACHDTDQVEILLKTC